MLVGWKQIVLFLISCYDVETDCKFAYVFWWWKGLLSIIRISWINHSQSTLILDCQNESYWHSSKSERSEILYETYMPAYGTTWRPTMDYVKFGKKAPVRRGCVLSPTLSSVFLLLGRSRTIFRVWRRNNHICPSSLGFRFKSVNMPFYVSLGRLGHHIHSHSSKKSPV